MSGPSKALEVMWGLSGLWPLPRALVYGTASTATDLRRWGHRSPQDNSPLAAGFSCHQKSQEGPQCIKLLQAFAQQPSFLLVWG